MIAGLAMASLWTDTGIARIGTDPSAIAAPYLPPGASGRVAAAWVQAQDSATVSSGSAVASAKQRKLEKAAEQFESLLLSNLWKSMKTAFGDDDDDSDDPAGGALEDWGMEAMSGAVGKAGGLGIGRLIIQHLEPKIATSPANQDGEIGKLGAKGWANSADMFR